MLPFAIADEAPARRNTLLWSAALVPLLASYCLAHDLLSRHPSISFEPLVWSIASLLPWAVAFEAIQRLRGSTMLTGRHRDIAILAIIAGTYLVSIPAMRGFKFLMFGDRIEWAVEALQRLPALAGLIALLAATGAIQRWRRLAEARTLAPEAADAHALPASADVIWARAAGNYVEFFVGGRTLLRRATLQSVEAHYAASDFVRIHRSTLVNRARITGTATQSGRLFVLTDDGAHHPVSAACRSRVEAVVRPFVP